MCDNHAALEHAGDDAHERQTVAVRGVHTGLHLEDDRTERIGDLARLAAEVFAPTRRRRQFDEGVEDLADAEVEHRGREDHRGGSLTGEEHLLIVVLAGSGEQFTLLGRGLPLGAFLGERRVGVHDLFGGGDLRAACGTGEADVLASLTVFTAPQQSAEVAGDADRPVQGGSV